MVLTLHLPGGIEENCENPQSESQVSGPRLKPGLTEYEGVLTTQL